MSSGPGTPHFLPNQTMNRFPSFQPSPAESARPEIGHPDRDTAQLYRGAPPTILALLKSKIRYHPAPARPTGSLPGESAHTGYCRGNVNIGVDVETGIRGLFF